MSFVTHTTADRCPGALRLHEAADGWLARIRVPGGRLDAAGQATIAAVARRGNGIVELTSRASVQVRGLDEHDAPAIATLLAAGGLLPSLAHDRVRNILGTPFAGPEADAAVAALDAGLCSDPHLASLSGRFLFAVDMPHPVADVLLFKDRLWLAGRATTLAGTVTNALGAARVSLTYEGWRIEDPARIAADLGGALDDSVALPSREPLRPGRRTLPDGRVATTALAPLGRLSVDQLERLPAEVRISPWRTLTSTTGGLEDLIQDPASGWIGLTACAGLGACTRAHSDVRAAAARRAQVRTPADPPEHHAACERCCGRPADPRAIIFTPEGTLV